MHALCKHWQSKLDLRLDQMAEGKNVQYSYISGDS